MSALRRFLIRLGRSVTRRRAERRLREAIEVHIALQTAENVRAGMSPVEARRQARLKFGAVEAVKEEYRDEQRFPALNSLGQDVRYALRQLRRAPLFTLTVTLTLGIGANAAVFSVFHQVLLRPLPVREPDRLVNLAPTGPQPGSKRCGTPGECNEVFSYPMSRDLERVQSLMGGRAHAGAPGRAAVSLTGGSREGGPSSRAGAGASAPAGGFGVVGGSGDRAL